MAAAPTRTIRTREAFAGDRQVFHHAVVRVSAEPWVALRAKRGCRLAPMAKQGFGPPFGTVEKGRGYHGMARYVRVSPDVGQQGVKSVNIDMPIEEVLKLRLALDSSLLAVNRYNRSRKEGSRQASVCR